MKDFVKGARLGPNGEDVWAWARTWRLLALDYGMRSALSAMGVYDGGNYISHY